MTMDLPASIEFCEVGPRDGLQNEKELISTDHKIGFAGVFPVPPNVLYWKTAKSSA